MLGFNLSANICQVYGGRARLATLKKLFPLMEDKKSLASADERARIKGKASLLAALDYYVSMHSDIFISASPGNMHNALVRTVERLKCCHNLTNFLNISLLLIYDHIRLNWTSIRSKI